MMTNKNQKTFIVFFSSLFVACFFLIKYFFEKIKWSSNIELVLAIIISSIIAILLSNLISNSSTRLKGVAFLVVFLFSYLFIMLLINRNEEKNINRELLGNWATQETDGDDLSITFYKRDSILITYTVEHKRAFKYILNEDKLFIFDEDASVLFNWNVIIKHEKLILYNESERLVFYKSAGTGPSNPAGTESSN